MVYLIFINILWIVVTLIAMWMGGRIALRFGKPKRKGTFWAFMIFMGWFHIVWAFEFVVTHAVAHIECQKAGVWTYITPEEWKKMPKINENQQAPEKITFEGRTYKYDYQVKNGPAVAYSLKIFPFDFTDAFVFCSGYYLL